MTRFSISLALLHLSSGSWIPLRFFFWIFLFVAFQRWFLFTFGTRNAADSSGLDIFGRKLVLFWKIVHSHDGGRQRRKDLLWCCEAEGKKLNCFCMISIETGRFVFILAKRRWLSFRIFGPSSLSKPHRLWCGIPCSPLFPHCHALSTVALPEMPLFLFPLRSCFRCHDQGCSCWMPLSSSRMSTTVNI